MISCVLKFSGYKLLVPILFWAIIFNQTAAATDDAAAAAATAAGTPDTAGTPAETGIGAGAAPTTLKTADTMGAAVAAKAPSAAALPEAAKTGKPRARPHKPPAHIDAATHAAQLKRKAAKKARKAKGKKKRESRKKRKKEKDEKSKKSSPQRRALLRIGMLDSFYFRRSELDALVNNNNNADARHKDVPLFTHIVKKVVFHPRNFSTLDENLLESQQKLDYHKHFTDTVHAAKMQAYLQLDEMTTTVALMLNENVYGRRYSDAFVRQLLQFVKAAGYDGIHLTVLVYHTNTQDRIDSFERMINLLVKNNLKFSFGIDASPKQDRLKNPCWSHAIGRIVAHAEFVVLLDAHETRLDNALYPQRAARRAPYRLGKQEYLVTQSLFLHGLSEYHKRGIDVSKFVLYASHAVVMQNADQLFTLSQSQYCGALAHAPTAEATSTTLARLDAIPYLHYANKKVEKNREMKQKVWHNAVRKLEMGLALSKQLADHDLDLPPDAASLHGVATLIDGDFRCHTLAPFAKSRLLLEECLAWQP